MKVRQYGRTGLFVPEITLGTASFGGMNFSRTHAGLDEDAARGQVSAAMDAGANLFDTADGYGRGESEVLLGRAIKTLGLARADFMVSTKVGLATGGGANDRGASRSHILDAASASLRKLGLDYVDIYHVHLPDRLTPIEETVGALQQVVARGYARYVACSNWLSWRVMKGIAHAERFGWARFDGIEAYYSLAGRDIERELVPLIQDEGLGLLAYSPQARGLLSGEIGPDEPRGIPVDKARLAACLEALRRVAEAHDCSLSRVAIAWVLTRPFVSSVIIGASSSAQLTEALAATDLHLSADEIEALDTASAPAPEYPAWLEPFADGQRIPKERRDPSAR